MANRIRPFPPPDPADRDEDFEDWWTGQFAGAPVDADLTAKAVARLAWTAARDRYERNDDRPS